MSTRRDFVQALPALGAAFAVGSSITLNESSAQTMPTPLSGHFHPKGKAPTSHTIAAIRRASANLPFGDTRDFEELKKGFIAPMPDLVIKADAGHDAVDMKRFQFLNEDREFDSIHPSMLRIDRLNNNYGLYEV
ncbi:MAG: MBL fold metallo-hydrolase, partial [Rhabdaerophilum sp.]